MKTEITTLELFEKGLSKSEIKSMAENAVSHVIETGEVLKAAEGLAAMENFIKEFKASEAFKDYTRTEIEKYGKAFTSSSGAKLELAETGSKYDYSMCNDPELEVKMQALETAQNDVKERQDFLKNLPLSGVDIVTSDGEVLKIYPPSKTSVSSYKVSLRK